MKLKKTKSQNSAPKKQILLLESHDAQRAFIGTFLAQNFVVKGTKTSIEALSCLGQGFAPDAIVFGTKITDMTAATFLSSLKSSGFFGQIPIIALGNKTAQDEMQELSELGVDAYYEPTFDPLVLQSNLIQILS